MVKRSLWALILLFTNYTIYAQSVINHVALNKTAQQYAAIENSNYYKALQLAKQKGWAIAFTTKSGTEVQLVGVDELGKPQYLATHNNIIAAATTNANLLWPNGSSGLNLSGASNSIKGKLAIWDGGSVLNTHVEMNGRVLQKDNPTSVSNHATHTSGTMIALGVNPIAKGMAFGAQQLIAYDYNNDVSEMSSEAPNLLLSNHSYGYLAGWYYDGTNWIWEGDINISKTEDYGFGYYDINARMFDSIAYLSPYYLICMSAGNQRNSNGPAVGDAYKYYDSSRNLVSGVRASGISNNDSYGTIAYTQNAKNILDIGAVNGIPLGYNNSNDVVMSNFSGWGPTDDGRIKPDVVADGVNVTSSIATSNTAYATYSGTSMAAPNATGSLYLVQEYYNKLHPNSFMRSSTLKGLAIHTANEAGSFPGPDYQFGWGLLDVKKATDVVTSSFNQQSDTIVESILNNGATYTFNITASGKGPLIATLTWIDPPIAQLPINSAVLNNTTPRLVNDLDMRIKQGNNTYQPWILDPANPANAAKKGDNYLDNVEKIQIDSVIPGKTYTITITNKGNLQRSTQAFSLIVSGIGGSTYCNSASTNNTGTRIDSVAFGGITNKNTSVHSNYSDFTNVTGNIQPNQTIPISIKVNSSDGSSATRKIKVFIDYNNNGSFNDPGEMVATNAVTDNSINGIGGIFTANIATPSGLKIGNYTMMRIVVRDSAATTDSATACGNYANGETQDYRIQFVPPTNDIAVVSVVAPSVGFCANNSQFLVIAIRNNGSVDQTNIPLTATIKNGNTTVASFNAAYPGTIVAGSIENYVFQNPFNSIPGSSYSITATANLATDQDITNNSISANVTIAGMPAAPSGKGEICSGTAYLNVTNSDSASNYFWYILNTAPTAFGGGLTASTSNITSNSTYYLRSGAKASIGPLNKTVLGAGGYNAFAGNYVNITASVPVNIDVAKLYISNPGKITFTVADISNVTSTQYSYTPYASKTIDVYATTPVATPPSGNGQIPDNPADSGAYYYLNLPIPAGNHSIIVNCANNATIYRNNAISNNPYPIWAPYVMGITGNSVQSPNNYQQYYYFFYDTKISTNDCISNMVPIVATTAATPTISLSATSLVSSITNAISYQWYLSGNIIANATASSYTPTKSGSYVVAVTDSLGCTKSSAAYSYVVTAVQNVSNTEIGLKASPNPAKGLFNVSFYLSNKADVSIELISTDGQIAMSKMYSGFSGQFNQQYTVGNMAPETYILKVQANNKIYRTKIVIVQ